MALWLVACVGLVICICGRCGAWGAWVGMAWFWSPCMKVNVCSYFCSPENFQVFDILVSNCMIQEPDYYAVYNVSIANDDEQIEAIKIWLY